MSQAKSINEGGATPTKVASFSESRLCEACEQPIPQKRLDAIPTAVMCVPCLEASGDVPLTKRFDEATKDGIVETMFTHNPYVEQSLYRLNNEVAPDEAFMIAIGDDSHLTREIIYPAEGGTLADAFEDEEEETVVPKAEGLSTSHKKRISAAHKKVQEEIREKASNGDITLKESQSEGVPLWSPPSHKQMAEAFSKIA